MTSLPPSTGRAAATPTAPTETSDAILEQMETLHPEVIDLTLDRVLRLLAELGNPQDRLQGVIHVAGTNGKGSVIAYLKAILEAAGKRVHVFTSPHLVRFHERITLSGAHGADHISEEDLCRYLRLTEKANAGEPITFFEITTAAAFMAFADDPADYVLLETGLGGRLDATNVVTQPALTIITSVSRDHERFLGTTLSDIAGEKAGILKPGVPCIVARQAPEAYQSIQARARELGAALIDQGQAWDAFEQQSRLVFQTDNSLLDLPLPRLVGRHQIDNAGVALAAAGALDDADIDETALARGLKTARWPARLQQLTHPALQQHVAIGSEIWLDGGHNESAAEALARAMAEMEERVPRPLHLICGMMTGKDASRFFEHFAGLSKWAATVTVSGKDKAFGADELAEIARSNGLDAHAQQDVVAALRASAGVSDEPARILICGSLYLAGEILGAMQNESPGA
ncbi:MAG: bifunctional folylpolyglutamate synthase/dihydrofolate synthase [Hyphomicrobiaceae bacterium]|nr:bifunctional folylpolyglutamate synthase/dihydrofolate synthase [Hyphomicrobiaceae bacterium]